MTFYKGKPEQEPSMEQILASIRRIISEDSDVPLLSTMEEDSEDMEPVKQPPAEFGLFPEEVKALQEEERLAAEWESFKRAEAKKYEEDDPDIAEFARAFHSPQYEVDPDISEEERLAAEWAALAGDGEDVPEDDAPPFDAPPFDPPYARVLNQDEIDSLLGFDSDPVRPDSGIMALVNSATINYERLPMLEVVFDRLCRNLAGTLRTYSGSNVEVSLDQICCVRFGDYINTIPLPAMFSVFSSSELDGGGLLTIDSALIYSMVDVLLGGRRGTAAMRIEGRPYTDIERALLSDYSQVILDQLSKEFSELSPVTFTHQLMETNPRFAAITRASSACFLVKLRVDMEDRGGRCEVLLPYATLEPVRELLMQMYVGDKFGRDRFWETHLRDSVLAANTNVEAILAEQEARLWQVLKWGVGQTFKFDCDADSNIQLRIGDKKIGTAVYHHKDGGNTKHTIQLEHILEGDENV